MNFNKPLKLFCLNLKLTITRRKELLDRLDYLQKNYQKFNLNLINSRNNNHRIFQNSLNINYIIINNKKKKKKKEFHNNA